MMFATGMVFTFGGIILFALLCLLWFPNWKTKSGTLILIGIMICIGMYMVVTSPKNIAIKAAAMASSQKPLSKFCYNGTLYERWNNHAASSPQVAYLNGSPIRCDGGS